MNKTGKSLILVAVLGLSLSACGDKQAANAPAAKAGVKVDGQEIGVAELDIKAGRSTGAKKHAISEPTMRQMVDMELLRQAAVKEKMDTDEAVRAKIAIANRMVLATAYMEKQLATVSKPTEAEIAAYFEQNPARFQARKQYEFHEFSIQSPGGKEAEIRARAGKLKAPEQFERWLTENNIQHGATPVSVGSDRLSDEVLAQLANVAVGGSVVLGGKDRINVIFVLAEQPRPIELAQAAPAIANLLVEKRKGEMLDNTIKQLREKAKIEYVAPYSASGYEPPKEQE